MIKTVAASTALFAAQALALGKAIVVNDCDYPVHMSNTPASGGGYSAIDDVLQPGGSYSQTWTSLTNGNGWALKLSKNGDYSHNVLQYEYTCQEDGIIWYDLSEVNGNPWNGNWEITASKGCSPRQAAYRYATDDAYGMQDCPEESDITVTICSGSGHGGNPDSDSGDDSNDGASAPAPEPTSSSSSPASSAAPPSYSAPSNSDNDSSEDSDDSSDDSSDDDDDLSWGVWDLGPNGAVQAHTIANKVKEAPSTTLAKVASKPADDNWNGPAVTVTNMHMETMTQYVTQTASPHAHRHRRHAHN